MPTIDEVRQKFPQYDDLSDDDLARSLHRKFYSDMPEAEFNQKIGIGASQPQAAAQPPQQPQEIHRGAILPWDRNADGSGGHLNWDSGIPGMVKRSLSLPGEVYRGEVPTMQPDEGQGVTSPELEARTKETASMMLPVSPAAGIGKAIAGVAGMPSRGPRPAPTREQLRTAGSQGYDRAFSMNVDFDPAVISQLASIGRAKLEQAGFNPLTAPNTFKALRALERPPPDSVVQLSGLEVARRTLRKGTSDTDREAGRIIIGALDKFVESPPPNAVLAGPAREAGEVLKDARGNWAALERSKEISGTQQRAERRAVASNSGRNIDNTLRQRVASVLDQIDKGRMKGFSKEEVAALNDFVSGNRRRNSARSIGNLLGGGGGLGSVVTGIGAGAAGGAVGGLGAGAVAGAAIPMIGWGAKGLQNRMGRNAMGKIDEAVRMRSPLYGTQAMSPPMPVPPGMTSQAAMRAAMMGLYPPPQGGGGW